MMTTADAIATLALAFSMVGCPSALAPTWDAGTDSGEDSDATLEDGDVLDRGADPDTAPDGGPSDGGPMLCSEMQPFPEPSLPPCTAANAACFRACADRACMGDCLRTAGFGDCWVCVVGEEFNCGLEVCPDQETAWDCCRFANCPPVPCSACDAELAAIRSCLDSSFLSVCRAWLEPCFPPAM